MEWYVLDTEYEDSHGPYETFSSARLKAWCIDHDSKAKFMSEGEWQWGYNNIFIVRADKVSKYNMGDE